MEINNTEMVGTVEERVQELDSNNTKKIVTKHYDYAHLILYCGACGTKSILEENVPKSSGVQINLPPTNTAEIMLVCKECNNRVGMFYVESTKKAEEPAKSEGTDEPVHEVSTIQE